MLGLADRTRVIDLFEHLARGDLRAAPLANSAANMMSVPIRVVVLSDLAEFVNFVTRVKIVPATAENVGDSARPSASAPGIRRKAVDADTVADVADAAEGHHRGADRDSARLRPPKMVLVRIAYVADLPTPDEAMRCSTRTAAGSQVPAAGAAPTRRAHRAGTFNVCRFADADACFAPLRHAKRPRGRKWWRRRPKASSRQSCGSPFSATGGACRRGARYPDQAQALKSDMRLVRFEDGRLEVALERNAARGLINDLPQAGGWTGQSLDRDRLQRGRPSDAALAERTGAERDARAAEAVRGCNRLLARFPGAKVIEVRRARRRPPKCNISAEDLNEFRRRRRRRLIEVSDERMADFSA